MTSHYFAPLVRALVLGLAVASWAWPCGLHAQSDAGTAAQRGTQVAPAAWPPAGDLAQRAQRLFEAVVRDDPAYAEPVFFPRDAFLKVKAMQNPGRYYDRLHARFVADIHALHRTLPELAQARFERLVLVRRGGLVKPGEEGNHLPYWASRHAYLEYRVGKQLRRFEVRVLITWEERWYVIHLSDF
jgi:hypothetical protein